MALAPRQLPRSPVKVIPPRNHSLLSTLSTPGSRRCHPTFGVNALNPGNRAEHTLPECQFCPECPVAVTAAKEWTQHPARQTEPDFPSHFGSRLLFHVGPA